MVLRRRQRTIEALISIQAFIRRHIKPTMGIHTSPPSFALIQIKSASMSWPLLEPSQRLPYRLRICSPINLTWTWPANQPTSYSAVILSITQGGLSAWNTMLWQGLFQARRLHAAVAHWLSLRHQAWKHSASLLELIPIMTPQRAMRQMTSPFWGSLPSQASKMLHPQLHQNPWRACLQTTLQTIVPSWVLSV